ncbi:hypothetical protein Salat_2228800 [Sesamum alatum]|uniref:Uncharacterized protein n=1 Tax=Sesamum alatum TaxID=300844 RepID=A0AAE2CDI9_9LAMI|nr:hypothetical protein Salat_2228800 [Sesamum alatum]
MWRRNALRFENNAQEDQDSDQSISEEEEGLEAERRGNTISLGGAGDNKGGMQVLSQLELLRGSYELHSPEKEAISSHERKVGYHIDDEVEDPLFNDGDDTNLCQRIAVATQTLSNERIACLPTMASVSDSDEEIVSDDEKIHPPVLRSVRENVGGTCSEASGEVEGLIRLNDNPSCSSSHVVFVKEKRPSKGAGYSTKAKPKFLFRSHSQISKPDEVSAVAGEDMGKYIDESELIFHEKESKQPEKYIDPSELAHKYDLKEHSMVEFLDCFKERSDLPLGSPELITERERRAQMVLERNGSSFGCRNLDDDDDLPEDLDSGLPSCSDDEENPQRLNSMIPRRTMVDQFHEAFGMVSAIDERPHLAFLDRSGSSGVYGKLQQVMLSEKEKDMDYLKNISAGISFKDERLHISVRILSRSLEAKLIVCSCTSVGGGKKSYWEDKLQMRMKGVATTLTIIFNTRICSDVELEVGSLILIHPPWKEVQVKVKGKDEIILLCSYFSQVQP